ncbi:SMP-30/gluconolactonase/LRE family protein [Helicobacter heilmannii]|uniref:SMP-30/gluconolactonase/LRE family protein n=1 Tax=Helicobacter heilmannii TaxID=35817 RepID=UPI00244D90CB|nr:SMP-30/gluconolactonase/LRE family protein [Helicobacter heilmannii]GMB95318.1 SMP-30/gluconolactonase/LRE family protein [Helicobacter heilmannii]
MAFKKWRLLPLAGLLCGLLQAQEAAYKVYNKAFRKLVNTKEQPQLLYDKGKWLEGPQVLADGDVAISDVRANEALLVQRNGTHFQVRPWFTPAGPQNGHALDWQGHLLATNYGKKGIERLEKGHWKVLVDSFNGQKFNSPNDLCIDRKGHIYFTDPKFGHNTQEKGGEYVYRYDPATHEIKRLSTPLLKTPNGIALSPDNKTLYVADSQLAHNPEDQNLKHQILAYDIDENGDLQNPRVFATIQPGFPDGIKVDPHGNLWASNGHGIAVFNPKGNMLGEIILPQVVSNLAFSLSPKALQTLQQHRVFAAEDSPALLFVTSGSNLYVFRLGEDF